MSAVHRATERTTCRPTCMPRVERFQGYLSHRTSTSVCAQTQLGVPREGCAQRCHKAAFQALALPRDVSTDVKLLHNFDVIQMVVLLKSRHCDSATRAPASPRGAIWPATRTSTKCTCYPAHRISGWTQITPATMHANHLLQQLSLAAPTI